MDGGKENPTSPSLACANRTPPAEFRIDENLIRGLLLDQHPDLAGLPLAAVDEGWDNAIFRLGTELAVRVPRRAVAANLTLHEQRWVPGLQRQLTLPITAPVRVGVPALGYPWPWGVVPWLKGKTADQSPPDLNQASVFGAFLRSLHTPAPSDAPANPFRGVALSSRAASMSERMNRLSTQTDLITSSVRRLWAAAVKEPLDTPPTWIHGDLHSRNVLVDQGIISGVIDWGDVCSGDRATDLAAAWMLFPNPEARAELWRAYGEVSPATRSRALGWVVLFGVVLLETGLTDHPGHAAIGRQILSPLADGEVSA